MVETINAMLASAGVAAGGAAALFLTLWKSGALKTIRRFANLPDLVEKLGGDIGKCREEMEAHREESKKADSALRRYIDGKLDPLGKRVDDHQTRLSVVESRLDN